MTDNQKTEQVEYPLGEGHSDAPTNGTATQESEGGK